MSEFNYSEIITSYQYGIGQEAALAMNGILTMTGRNYQQVKAGEGVSTEVMTAFAMFEGTASRYLGPSTLNDTLMQTQKGTIMPEQSKPKALEVATLPLIESFLSDEELEARTRNEEAFDKTVHELLEPVINAFLDKVPEQPQKRRFWQREQAAMRPTRLTVNADNLCHSLTVLAATDGSRLASIHDSIKQYPFYTDDEAAFQVQLDAFGNDQLERLEAVWKNRHDHQQTRQAFETYGRELSALLDAAGHADGNSKLYRYMKRDAFGRVGSGPDPQTCNSIALNFKTRSFTIHSSNPTLADDSARRVYTLDPVRNVFAGHDGKNRQLKDISVGQYFGVVRSLLNALPLAELPTTSNTQP